MESGLNGTVEYMGQECNPEVFLKTSKCRAPVPNHEILIYDEDRKNVIATTQTNDKGEYFISLEPGTYVIIPNQSNPISISIKENEINSTRHYIDKGIR
jgi:hypothetical protein